MKRVQRKRIKGYRLPTSTKCVNRGTKWGNPFKVVPIRNNWIVKDEQGKVYSKLCESKDAAAAKAVELYAVFVKEELQVGNLSLDELRTFDNLACFCSLHSPCHADVLIELLSTTG